MAKIRIENIRKVFNPHSRSRNQVLKGVSFELPEKGLVAIFGKSGSGKTTLLNIIGGLDRQDSGKIYIDGECTAGKVDRIRNEKIGFIFQNYYLERGYTIAEIMRNQMLIAGFTDESEIARRTHEVLTLVDMERYRNKRGDALSGGQQQRVAIARALIKGSDVILADEPTGNLDAENTIKVMEILKEISKTRLVVLVTHEVALIRRYADSHIGIVDGQLSDTATIDDEGLFKGDEDAIAVEKPNAGASAGFTHSTARRNGRLFTLRHGFRRRGEDEKAFSTGDLFKQIFIFTMAIVMCFFAFRAYEIINAEITNKSLDENAVYTNIARNDYMQLRALDRSLYTDIDFFETHLREGRFSYHNLASLSGLNEDYIPHAVESGDTAETVGLEYGEMPESGEVLLSRGLAEKLKRDLRIPELQNDRSLLLLLFEDDFRVSGIAAGEDPFVLMNKVDYVNFLGVYDTVNFYTTLFDGEPVFFDKAFVQESGVTASYTSEICAADEELGLSENQVMVEISRNALFGMLSDTTQADVRVRSANARLSLSTTAVYIVGSRPMYVKSFKITRDPMATDIRIHVPAETLDNLFVYISPNLDNLNAKGDTQYFFKVGTEGGAQREQLLARFTERGVESVDVQEIFDRENAETWSNTANSLALVIAIAALMFVIYFFIEKSGSVQTAGEYGIYRAIGVNRSNLLFKEVVATLVHNITFYCLWFAGAVVLLSARYSVMNVAYGGFILLSLGVFAASAVIMVGISLIPYLFVIRKTPAQILAKYDI